MNREKIISLARECGVFEVQYPHPGNLKEIESFYQRVRNAALEEAAVKCDEVASDGDTYGMQYAADCAAEIRLMKETK